MWLTVCSFSLLKNSTNRNNDVPSGIQLIGGCIGPCALEEKVQIELGTLDLEQEHDGKVGEEVNVLLREDDIQHDDNSPVQAEVVRKTFRGADFLYTLRLKSGTEVYALVPSHHDHAIGEKIGICLAADHVVTFKDQSSLLFSCMLF